jgi:hypothetical protein
MGFKEKRAERREEARRRLRERPMELPSATRPRGNMSVDQADLKRSLERMESLVGR